MTTIIDVEKTAKEVLEKTGKHNTQLIVENGKQVEVILLVFETQKEKELMYKAMRKHIDDIQSSRYFVIMEGWAGTADSNLPPSEQPDKKEVLIISEFQRNMKNMTIINWFTRDGKKIIWGERVFNEKNDETVSRFNFFIEDNEQTRKELEREVRWKTFLKDNPTALVEFEKYLDEHKEIIPAGLTKEVAVNIFKDMVMSGKVVKNSRK